LTHGEQAFYISGFLAENNVSIDTFRPPEEVYREKFLKEEELRMKKVAHNAS